MIEFFWGKKSPTNELQNPQNNLTKCKEEELLPFVGKEYFKTLQLKDEIKKCLDVEAEQKNIFITTVYLIFNCLFSSITN